MIENSVFISGSISIKNLPHEVKESIDKIINNKMQILVGDANGIDSLVQDYCLSLNYFNIMVYSISLQPRYRVSKKFALKYIEVPNDIKGTREKQQHKDRAMTIDSQYGFIIWDGKSKGSYANIIRALEHNKKIKLYRENRFLKQSEINRENIEFIYRKNTGYTAFEVVQQFKNIFHRTQDLNRYLLQNSIIKKDNNVYQPMTKYEDLFIVDKYRGQVKGIKFRSEFLAWIKMQKNLPLFNLK
jgi:predicted Rossmann fold nucleotide-binding protein DprA/Smf involved in DNA uptake